MYCVFSAISLGLSAQCQTCKPCLTLVNSFFSRKLGHLSSKIFTDYQQGEGAKSHVPLSFVEPCQTQSNMAYMSAWYIAIHGQMLPDYSQNINLVAAAPSRGSAGYWKHRGGTGDTVETCPDTITISNNTVLHRGKCCNEW